MTEVTPEDVMRLIKPTDGFLCTLAANSYGIEFLSFVISDYETKNVIFEVKHQSRALESSLQFFFVSTLR